MVHLTDEALMQLVQQGDLDKMRPLFDRYHVRIYNYCLHLSGEREASKDITQEVFYRVLKFRATYRATTFATWLYAIARNLCYDHH
ncbi:MAG: sigma factor, partial [Bacteroidota bacterium]